MVSWFPRLSPPHSRIRHRRAGPRRYGLGARGLTSLNRNLSLASLPRLLSSCFQRDGSTVSFQQSPIGSLRWTASRATPLPPLALVALAASPVGLGDEREAEREGPARPLASRHADVYKRQRPLYGETHGLPPPKGFKPFKPLAR